MKRGEDMSEIEIKNVSKKYETKDGTVEALKNVSLSIEQGDIYGIIGMSGAGKSTLVRCMNFLEEPTEGQVLIKGRTLGSLSKKELRKQREDIGMIFQHFNLLMQKSVIDNVCFPLYIQGKKKKEARAKALELLEIVGLQDRAKAYPAQLSGGQKQRVAIASILELLESINKRFGITIVIITHQMSVVREICTHVAIMKDGQVAEKGLVTEIFEHPKSEVARELINKDTGSDVDGTRKVTKEINNKKNLRIVFSESSAFEPVIANMILKFNEPVNILKANTKNVGGVAKGEMILGFREDNQKIEEMKQYLIEKGLEIEEVDNYVD